MPVPESWPTPAEKDPPPPEPPASPLPAPGVADALAPPPPPPCATSVPSVDDSPLKPAAPLNAALPPIPTVIVSIERKLFNIVYKRPPAPPPPPRSAPPEPPPATLSARIEPDIAGVFQPPFFVM